jgi:Flp pilus assembly protein TadD
VAALALTLYFPVLGNDFINYDDPVYFTGNPHVLAGVTLENLRWSLTTVEGGNWHPLTWWSHQLTVTLFGTRPWGHHLVNAVLHAAAAGALCAVLAATTGLPAPAFLVAALFAVHPLHVESVAWIAERKDVLAALLWAMTIGAWLAHLRRPGRLRYSRALVIFALALATKPILVVLPLVLLVLDFWPLGRLRDAPAARIRVLVAEKAPFLLLALAAGVVALRAQNVAGGLAPLAAASPRFIEIFVAVRFENAALSAVSYLFKTLWPSRLAVFYPHPAHAIARWELLLACLLLAGVTVAVFSQRHQRPWLGAGWAWYVITLLPTIGLVQVGDQGLADRYTYLPLIGIFLAAAWSAHEIAVRGRRSAGITATLIAGALALLAAASVHQMGYWRSTEVLFSHAAAVTAGNHLAHRVLGEEYRRQGRFGEAELHFREALTSAPLSAGEHNRLGLALSDQGRLHEAIAAYREAIRIRPDYDEALNNLGVDLTEIGEPIEGEFFLRQALKVSPERAEIWFNLGNTLARQGKTAEAAGCLRRALGLKPDLAAARVRVKQLLGSGETPGGF